MRVRVLADFDWTPPDQPQVTLALLAGEEKTVRRLHGEAAVAAGKAEEIGAPARKQKPDGEA